MYLDFSELESGAPTRTRTADLLITNQLLYQLSYRGTGRRLLSLAKDCKPHFRSNLGIARFSETVQKTILL